MAYEDESVTHSSGSRLDDFWLDRCTFARAAVSGAVADRFGSDHQPITVRFPVAASPAAALAFTADSPVGLSVPPPPPPPPPHHQAPLGWCRAGGVCRAVQGATALFTWMSCFRQGWPA